VSDVKRRYGGPQDDRQTHAVDAAEFSRYAEEDLARWKQLVGGETLHADPRWSVGRVVDVRWGAAGGYTASYIQIRVRYAEHGTVVFRASSFAAHHRSVTVSAEVREIIRDCFEEERSASERRAILDRHARELLEARDRERLERANELKRRTLDRRALGD